MKYLCMAVWVFPFLTDDSISVCVSVCLCVCVCEYNCQCMHVNKLTIISLSQLHHTITISDSLHQTERTPSRDTNTCTIDKVAHCIIIHLEIKGIIVKVYLS